MKRKAKKITTLSVATAILSHPEVQKVVKQLAQAGFEKARRWWDERDSRKSLKLVERKSRTALGNKKRPGRRKKK